MNFELINEKEFNGIFSTIYQANNKINIIIALYTDSITGLKRDYLANLSNDELKQLGYGLHDIAKIFT